MLVKIQISSTCFQYACSKCLTPSMLRIYLAHSILNASERVGGSPSPHIVRIPSSKMLAARTRLAAAQRAPLLSRAFGCVRPLYIVPLSIAQCPKRSLHQPVTA